MSTDVRTLLLIASGGAIGAVLRFLISGWSSRLFTYGEFPWGTFMVNGIGCLLIGMLWAVLERSPRVWMQPLLITGVLGGFTTFSAFGLETFNLLRIGVIRGALLYAVGSLVAGVCLVAIGYWTLHRVTSSL